MSLRPFPGFVGPSYTPESKIAAYDETYNWFCERIESGTGNTQAQYVLYPTPGFFSDLTMGDSPGRGGLSIGGTGSSGSISGNTYLVAGSTLYLYAVPPTSLATGIVNGSDSVIEMVTNGDQGHQLLFQSDSTAYCFDTTTHVLTNEGIGHSVAFLNGYGLRLDQFDNKFFFSALFDFSTWDPLDVVVRSDASDNWLRLIVYHNEVWLFGARTTSVYYNGQDPDIPFQPIVTAFMNTGIYAPASACIVGGSLFWIGQDSGGNGVVYRANGYNPERVSTHPIELLLQSSRGQPLLAEGTYYQNKGHDFYEITVPGNSPELPGGTNGYTIVYDVTEGLWSKRGEWTGLEYKEMDTRGYFGGNNIMLSRTSGKIYSVITNPASAFASLGTNGLGIKRLRRCPHMNDAQNRIRYSHLRVLMETGLGLSGTVPTPGVDPEISLRWSDDGGQTFGSSYTVSAGKLGEFSTLVEWRQLGQARDRIFELTCDAPVPWRLVNAFLDYSVGPS